jgi:outer membrane lipoprotein-sorting protein
MRRTKWTVVALLVLASLTFIGMSRAASDPQAQEAVDRVGRLFSSKSSIATVNMQISNDDGQRNLSMKIWSLGDKTIVRITSPENEAGVAILKVGNDLEYYLPKSNRTVKVPASMAMTSWMGSDFTIDDLVKEKFLTRDYLVSNSFEGTRGGVAVHEYTLVPKPGAAVVWDKIVLQVRQADSVPTWQGFYDEDGKLVRQLTFSEYKTIDGRLIPTRLVMQPTDKAGARTTIDYQTIAFDAPISEGTFTLPNSKQ